MRILVMVFLTKCVKKWRSKRESPCCNGRKERGSSYLQHHVSISTPQFPNGSRNLTSERPTDRPTNHLTTWNCCEAVLITSVQHIVKYRGILPIYAPQLLQLRLHPGRHSRSSSKHRPPSGLCFYSSRASEFGREALNAWSPTPFEGHHSQCVSWDCAIFTLDQPGCQITIGESLCRTSNSHVAHKSKVLCLFHRADWLRYVAASREWLIGIWHPQSQVGRCYKINGQAVFRSSRNKPITAS